MSKPIRAYPKSQQRKVIRRRLSQQADRGIGYNAAMDSLKHLAVSERLQFLYSREVVEQMESQQ